MDESRNKIVKDLNAIEKGKKVKVILAVESGSKAWNIQSLDSDFDAVALKAAQIAKKKVAKKKKQ